MTKLIRMRGLEDQSGLRRSKLYMDISEELMVPPIKDGPVSLWPQDEVDKVLEMKIAGSSKDELRKLVKTLVGNRAKRAPRLVA